MPSERKFKVGDRVSHPRLGECTVVCPQAGVGVVVFDGWGWQGRPADEFTLVAEGTPDDLTDEAAQFGHWAANGERLLQGETVHGEDWI